MKESILKNQLRAVMPYVAAVFFTRLMIKRIEVELIYKDLNALYIKDLMEEEKKEFYGNGKNQRPDQSTKA